MTAATVDEYLATLPDDVALYPLPPVDDAPARDVAPFRGTKDNAWDG
jgi:hypothetical protein